MIARVLGLGLISLPLYAMDLGVFGKTYPIIEFPADKLIEQKIQSLSSEKKQALEKHFLEKTKVSVMDPQGVFLPRVSQSSHRWFNPSLHFSEEIVDQNGKTVVPQNTRVNPLDHISLNKPFVFFDGKDEVQTLWVKKHYLDATLILIQGNPLQLEEEWHKKVFFDQGGQFRQRFSIKALPTVVTQEGKRLRIAECVPS